MYDTLTYEVSQAIAKEELTKYIIEHYKVASIAVENEAGEYCKIPSEDIGKYTPHFLNPSFSSKSLFDLEKCGDQELTEAELISKTASLHTAGGVQVAVSDLAGGAIIGSIVGCTLGVLRGLDGSSESSVDTAVVGSSLAGFGSVIGSAIAQVPAKSASLTVLAAVATGAIFAVTCNKVTLAFQKRIKN